MAKIKKIKLPNDETLYELEGSITDISNTTSNIDSITTDYPDISASDKASTLFGKIKKFLSDLKSKKQDKITGAATTITSSDLTANRVLQSDSNGKVAASGYEFDISTNNTSDTLLLVMNGTKIQHRLSTDLSVNYATSARSATNATNATYAVSLENKDASDKNSVNGNGWYSVAASKNNVNIGGNHKVLAINWYWGIDIRTGDNTWLWHNGNPVITSAGGTIKGNLNISGNYSYRLNNRVSMYDLGTTVFGLCANGGATVRRYDNANNYAGISANAFTNVSSRLIKKNIKNISDDEAKKILDLRIVDFDYEEIVGGETGQIGLIAEETIDIFPHCVKVPDNYNEETTKQQLAEGKVLDLLELDYSKLVAPLIKMVQIQQRQIEELKAEVERLKDAIES